MHIASSDHAWLEDNVLLDMLAHLPQRLQVGALALRTTSGCGNFEAKVNLLGLGTHPGWMAHGSAPLFALRRGTLLSGGVRLVASLELSAMQRMELCLELLFFQFQRFALPPFLIEEAVELF